MHTISVTHLSKTYESWKKAPGLFGTLRSLVRREVIRVPAVRDISFTIAPGEFVGFIGRNGAGKTTTLKMLSGILHPTSGEARVMGHIPWTREHAYLRRIALVMGQKNQLWWDLPPSDAFALNQAIYRIPMGDYTKRLTLLGEALAVDHLFDVPVRKLSLGERMKCELINALLHNPSVLFLDEPTIGLDVVAQQTIRDFLRRWNKEEGTTVLLTSHAMDDVEALCPRILVIHEGMLPYDGALAAFVARVVNEKEIAVTFSKDVASADLARLGTVVDVGGTRAVLRVPRGDVHAMAKVLLTKFPVVDLTITELPIEEAVRRSMATVGTVAQ